MIKNIRNPNQETKDNNDEEKFEKVNTTQSRLNTVIVKKENWKKEKETQCE